MSTLTDRDFERIHAEGIKRLSHQDGYDTEDEIAWQEAQLRSVANLEAFWDWRQRQIRAGHEARKPIIPSAGKYIETIRADNYKSLGEVVDLAAILTLRDCPYIGLGTYRGCGYRLAPDIDVLEATKTPDWENGDNERILPDMFLGINKNVVPVRAGEKQKRSRADTRAEESNISADSDSGNDETGFVFFQLGRLESVSPKFRDPKNPTKYSWAWNDTGYVVVVVINTNGYAGAVYILFKFSPKNEDREQSKRATVLQRRSCANSLAINGKYPIVSI